MFQRRRFYLRYISILLFLGITACAGPARPNNPPVPTIVDTQTPVIQETPIPTPSPTLSPTQDPTPTPAAPQRTKYTIDAVLDYNKHHLQVEEKIHYTNHSSDPLNELILMVDPLYFPGTFKLDRLEYGDGKPLPEPQQENGWLRFPLSLPLLPGDTIDLSLAYQLNLPSPVPSAATRPIPFGYTERQTNLVDWYPFIPPYISEQGWLAHPASYYGEHLVYEKSDFAVNIRLSDPQPNLIIAASAPVLQDGEWYRFQHDNARNFAWSISPYYQTQTAQAGPVKVTTYAFSGQEKASQAVLTTTVEALELYSKLFGEYPRQSLNVVEADFLDGMEYDGMYFLSKGFYNLYTGTPGEYLVAIAAHETAHQWWYAMVGNDQALEPWLDEALCTYMEHIYFENLHPEALDWWWTYRINYYQPRGWVDDSIYNPHGEIQAYRAYRNAVYLNGAVFLDELRKTMGDQAFFEFLKAYAAQNRDQIATKNSFFSLANQFSQSDLMPLIKQYFYHSE